MSCLGSPSSNTSQYFFQAKIRCFISQRWLYIPVLPSCDTIVLPVSEMLDVTSVLTLLCLFQLAVFPYAFYLLLISEVIALYSYTLS